MQCSAAQLDNLCRSGDVQILTRKWNAAQRGDRALPPFEDIMLGSLGFLSDHLMLIELSNEGDYVVLRGGRAASKWCQHDFKSEVPVDKIPADTSAALRYALDTANARGKPYLTNAYRLHGGIVETCDIYALPLSCRWQQQLFAVYLRACTTTSNLLEMIYDATSGGMISLAALRDSTGAVADFQIVDLNKAAGELLGASPDELRWQLVSSRTDLLSNVDTRRRLRIALDSREPMCFEFADGDDGKQRHYRISICPMDNLLSLVINDVTDFKLRENSFRLLFENNPVPMWIFDPQTLQFLAVNDATLSHYGYERQDFLDMPITALWPADEAQEHLQAVGDLPDHYQSSESWRHLRADGSEIDVLTFGRRVNFQDRSAFLVSTCDITERRRAEERIAYMAHHDALTGLANRVLYQHHLEDALIRTGRAGTQVAVLCLDLDEFKSVNDSLGHPIGDRLLQLVAERLREQSSQFDLVARLGGDEFAIIVEAVSSPQSVERLAACLVETVGRPYLIDSTEIIVGTSIGIAMSPHDGETQDALIRNADIALYRAKSSGRRTYQFFEKEMDRKLQERRTLAADLRRAFTAGEFEVYYQPLIDLKSDRVSGFEALIRWHHPVRGMVSPVEFIPVLEEMGLIVQVGEWVLQQACREAAKWPDDIRVAVNLSPVQFRSPNLVQAVLGALAHSGLSAYRLELEVTESVLLAETDANIDILHRLRALGTRVSMDDFGTGYSSLGYLRSFPFDKIKIDRSFVSDMASRPDCFAIVRAIVGLGSNLGVTTTAEGVENADQLDRLRLEGCDEVQGYLFSRPEPASAIPGLIAKFGQAASQAA